MDNLDKVFWAAVIIVGIWAAATPGHQLSLRPKEYYRYSIANYIPWYFFVVFFLCFAYALFVKKS
jgi:hypothetical protein